MAKTINIDSRDEARMKAAKQEVVDEYRKAAQPEDKLNFVYAQAVQARAEIRVLRRALRLAVESAVQCPHEPGAVQQLCKGFRDAALEDIRRG